MFSLSPTVEATAGPFTKAFPSTVQRTPGNHGKRLINLSHLCRCLSCLPNPLFLVHDRSATHEKAFMAPPCGRTSSITSPGRSSRRRGREKEIRERPAINLSNLTE